LQKEGSNYKSSKGRELNMIASYEELRRNLWDICREIISFKNCLEKKPSHIQVIFLGFAYLKAEEVISKLELNRLKS